MGTELHPGSSFQLLTEGVASVVRAATEALVLEAVVASSSTSRLEFEVREPHTRLTSGDLVFLFHFSSFLTVYLLLKCRFVA